MDSDKPVNPIAEAYVVLTRIPPGARLIAGLAWVAVGVSLTLLLWNGGIIWGLSLFVVVAGVLLSVSGLREIRRRAYRESVLQRGEELIRGMLDVKRRGRNPLQWLREEGVRDPEIRAELLRAMNQRLKSAPGDSGGGRARSP